MKHTHALHPDLIIVVATAFAVAAAAVAQAIVSALGGDDSEDRDSQT